MEFRPYKIILMRLPTFDYRETICYAGNMSKKTLKNLIDLIAPKRVLRENKPAFETYEHYKKTSDLIEKAEFASGKRVIFKSGTGSTLNFEINRNGAYSTTTQEI